MKISKAQKQLYQLQDLIFAAAQTDCSKPDLARLSIAWERLEERKRILKGRPLPGSLRPEKVPRLERKFGSIHPLPPPLDEMGQ